MLKGGGRDVVGCVTWIEEVHLRVLERPKLDGRPKGETRRLVGGLNRAPAEYDVDVKRLWNAVKW